MEQFISNRIMKREKSLSSARIDHRSAKALRRWTGNAKYDARFSGVAEGFTIIEVLVIVGMLAFSACLLAPALARTKTNGLAIHCLNNTRQLIRAWQMYTEDNHGKIALNYHGGDAMNGNYPAALGPGWASGWLDWTTSPDNTNVAFVANARYATLAPYVHRDPTVFKCPADKYLSEVQKVRGWTQRVRSYSASLGIGAGNAAAGPWDSIYRQTTNTDTLLFPGPAETFVFLDEHPDSISDPGYFSPAHGSWIDIPTTLHNGAAAVAFADGHLELHKWTGSLASGRATQVYAIDGSYINGVVTTTQGDPDLHWVSYHTSRVSTNSY